MARRLQLKNSRPASCRIERMPNPLAEEGCESSDLHFLHPSTSGRMTAVETCALPGCSKPPFPSSPGHLTCGTLHHNLLMVGRFDPALPHPHQQILDRNGAGLCALPSCSVPPHPGHSWCSRSHYLLWLSKFTSSLLPEQICKLPGCVRHIFVDNSSSPSQFCGWHHCQKFVMRSVLQRQQQQLQQQESLPAPPSSVESSYGHLPSIESLVLSMRDYVCYAKSPKNVRIDEDFFNKHPWDICTGGLTCLLIVRSKYSSKGKRLMVTKDGYHWKQQGRPVIQNTTYTRKYFTYRKLKGREDEAADVHEECTYFMDEYTMEVVKEFSLIKLRKSKGSHSKHLKGRPIKSNKQFCGQVNDTYSHNTISTKDDEMAVDSCFWNLSPLDDDCPYDLDQFLG